MAGVTVAVAALLIAGALNSLAYMSIGTQTFARKLPATEKAELFETLYLSLKKECDIPKESLDAWRHVTFVYSLGSRDDVQQKYEEIKDKCKRGAF